MFINHWSHISCCVLHTTLSHTLTHTQTQICTQSQASIFMHIHRCTYAEINAGTQLSPLRHLIHYCPSVWQTVNTWTWHARICLPVCCISCQTFISPLFHQLVKNHLSPGLEKVDFPHRGICKHRRRHHLPLWPSISIFLDPPLPLFTSFSSHSSFLSVYTSMNHSLPVPSMSISASSSNPPSSTHPNSLCSLL